MQLYTVNLQRPATQQGVPLFGAPRPERPSAPANPGGGARGAHWSVFGAWPAVGRLCNRGCAKVPHAYRGADISGAGAPVLALLQKFCFVCNAVPSPSLSSFFGA